MIDELLPLPSQTPTSQPSAKPSLLVPMNVLRRTGSVAIITIFLLSITFMASTEPAHRVTGLRTIFGVGSDAGLGGAGWVAQDLGDAMSGIGGAKNGAIGELDELLMHVGRIARGLVGKTLCSVAGAQQLMGRLRPVHQDADSRFCRCGHLGRTANHFHR